MRNRSSVTAERDSDLELKQRPGRAAAEPASGGRQGSEVKPSMGKKPFRRLGLLGKMKRIMMVLLLVYISIPFIIKLFPSIQAKLVFLNFGECFSLIWDLSASSSHPGSVRQL
ncbi:hypothetical protein XENOCAPTIV_025237, partial [Xenoophorus captivus]